MQTASRWVEFNVVEDNNNDNSTDINDIINTIANAATQQSPEAANVLTIADIIKNLQALQDKIDLLTQVKSNRKRNASNKTYYWTHGRTRNTKHASSTCMKKTDNHKTEVT